MQARVVSNEKYNHPHPPYTHTNVDLKDEYEDVLVNICMLMEIPYVLRQNVDTINLILFIGRRGCLFHFFYHEINMLIFQFPSGRGSADSFSLYEVLSTDFDLFSFFFILKIH